MTRLAEGVWLHRSWQELPEYGRVPANGLVVVSDGEAALVDTPWTDAQTRALASWVRTRLDSQVTTVVPTHSHADCMGGLGAAHQLGRARTPWTPRWRSPGETACRSPRRASTASRTSPWARGSSRRASWVAGHTADTVVVWLPDARILFGGDLVRSAGSRALGFTGEADLGAWPGSVAALERAYGEARVVVPGHGAPGGRSCFATPAPSSPRPALGEGGAPARLAVWEDARGR